MDYKFMVDYVLMFLNRIIIAKTALGIKLHRTKLYSKNYYLKKSLMAPGWHDVMGHGSHGSLCQSHSVPTH